MGSGDTTTSSGSRRPNSAWPRRRAGAASTRPAATGSRRPVSRFRRRSAGRDHSSVSWWSGWPKPAESRRCRSRRRWRRRSGACRHGCSSRRCTPKPTPSTSPQLRSPGLRGTRHICGSLIEASYPLGPRLGCPMNITAFGNDEPPRRGHRPRLGRHRRARAPDRVPARRRSTATSPRLPVATPKRSG